MKKTLLADICCPECGGGLDLQVGEQSADRIQEGDLECASCKKRYPIHKGIPDLMPQNAVGSAIASEMQGWVALWEKKGMYENPDWVSSFKLPYLNGGPWPPIAQMFDFARQEMNLKGTETILDIGAGQGWAARYFAEKGCRVFALDIVADEIYGLGRAWAIMEHANVYFEPLLADGEQLPFSKEKFDIVYYSAALHHFERFDQTLTQAYRVLKPGGLLVASSEPVISLFSNERKVQANLEEIDEGITERRPKLPEYWWTLSRVGFQGIRFDTAETFSASAHQIYAWVLLVRQNLMQVVKSKPLLKPFVWLVLSIILMLPPRWAGASALLINGGTIILRAVKPTR
jgi:ubiquinone/menaquinone biosynthesis C-methylase UbiE/uncharacterized protein YbaR (Trm112 family)